LREQVDGKWDHRVEATKVPKGLRLVMGDVDCGSSTPGMVRKVLAWRGADETAEELWRDLEGRNTGLIELLGKAEERSRENGEEWQSAVKTWGTGGQGETESVKLLNEISKQVGAIREKIREMGRRAEVPIEPEAQTRLLDAAAAAVPGVLGGVVPGAGGYDAVVFLCVDREETVQQLEEFLRGYKFVGEDGKEGSVAVLEAREEMEGVRVEDFAQY
jgi:phosphomevalonate kinase